MNTRSNLLRWLLLAFLPLMVMFCVPTAHAQHGGDPDDIPPALQSFYDGSTMAQYINLSAEQQSLLENDLVHLGFPVPAGLMACIIDGQHDGGTDDYAGYGYGSYVYNGSVGYGNGGGPGDGEPTEYASPGSFLSGYSSAYFDWGTMTIVYQIQ